MKENQFSMIALCCLSLSFTFVNKLVWVTHALAYGWETDELWLADANFSKTHVGSRDLFAWTPDYSTLALSIKLLKSDYLAELPGALDYSHAPNTDYHYIGLAPCSYDIYLFCKFGIMAILFLYTTMIAILQLFWWKIMTGIILKLCG